MTSNGKKKKTAAGVGVGVDDEVEELLKAAEDEVFLKLSVDSHMSRVSPSYLHSDLDRRFQSLKKPNKPTPIPKSSQSTTTAKDATIVPSAREDGAGDDLLARFAALKGSLPSSSSSSVPPSKGSDHCGAGRIDENVDIGDEVEKIIQWAIDAARLDPSPPTDDEAELDDDDDNDSDEEDSQDSDDDRRAKGNKKGNRK